MRRAPFAVVPLVVASLLCACGTAPSASLEASAPDGGPDVFVLSAAADRAYRESRWLEAARGYAELTEAVPGDAYAWFRLGNTHARQGDYGRAIDAYETSLERDGAQPKPWFNLATAHLLHAQVALLRARERLRADDPARTMIDARLDGLRALVHGRLEDVSAIVPAR